MLKIIFETHSTTLDNEKHISSGWYDIDLSELGIKQSQELGERYKNIHLDAIFCSDLQRSFKTAKIAFENCNIPIIQDLRLRECNYGDYTQKNSDLVTKIKLNYISTPFPNGESYINTSQRIKDFLEYLIKNYDNKTIMIIGHRATQYGLEHLINNIPLETIISTPWKWEPGWIYNLKN